MLIVKNNTFFNSTCLVIMVSVAHCIITVSATHKCCVAHCIIAVSATHKCCVAHCIITVSATHLCCVHLFYVVLSSDRLIACFLQDVKVMNNNKRKFKKSFLKILSILCRL